MIFILKRDVLQQCYMKYLNIRGRLPKKPIRSITDLMTNRVIQGRTNAVPSLVPLNDINQGQHRVPFPREENQLPFPRESNEALLAGNQSTSQNLTPRAILTRSAYM